MKKIFSLGIFFALLPFSQAKLSDQVPSRVSLLVSGPGDTLTSSFGHVDLLLSYGNQITFKDTLIGFGPPADQKISIWRALGWKKPAYPMTMWQSDLKDRIREALSIHRKYIDIIPLKLNFYERDRIVEEINRTFSKIGKVPYLANNHNCSSLVSEIISTAAKFSIDSKLKHRPLENFKLYSGLNLARDIYHYDYKALQKINEKIIRKTP